MDATNTQYRTIGVNFNKDGEARIVVWAPLANSASVLLTETNQMIRLKKEDFGYWSANTHLLRKNDLYKFVLDGKMLPDPASQSQPEGVHGPSQAVDVTDFKWDDDTWLNHNLADYIIYELHTGTFSDQGNFQGIEEKLDYLKSLGITAIEIMPVAQFAGARNWGYDGVFPYAVQSSYGGFRALQHLVNSCHKRGIAVILDVVYNHLGPEGNYLHQFGPYFTSKYSTPWGDAVNFDDEWCDGVRRYFIENALMWFREFHIDALRLDAVHAIKDFSPVHILAEIRRCVNLLMKATGRRHYLITEVDLNDSRYINPLEKNGLGMDAQWIDEFHHALRVTAGEEKKGYYADFTGISHLAKSYRDAYVYDGQFSPHRKKTFGIKADNPGNQFVVFSQNHDQVGNRMFGERTSQLVSSEMQKLLVAAVMVSPYIPLLFMGEEWAETNPFLFFTDYSDMELAAAVREGRKQEFASFHFQSEPPDPTDVETFNQSKLQWHLQQQEPHQNMLAYYRKLIEMRRTNPVLKTLDRKSLDIKVDEGEKILVLHRWQGADHLLCFMNFSSRNREVPLPGFIDTWQKLFSSAGDEWNHVAIDDAVSRFEKVQLPGEAMTIYRNMTLQ